MAQHLMMSADMLSFLLFVGAAIIVALNIGLIIQFLARIKLLDQVSKIDPGYEISGRRRKDELRYWVLIAVSSFVIGITIGGTVRYFTENPLGQSFIAEAFGKPEQMVTVYAADGDIVAQYTGNITIKRGLSGRISIIVDGNEYIYYNCSVERVPALPESDNEEE